MKIGRLQILWFTGDETPFPECMRILALRYPGGCPIAWSVSWYRVEVLWMRL